MTIDTIQPAPAPAPTRLGQATAVEQSRAVAEVAAAVQVAQMCPRDVRAATEEMRRACAQPRLADRAFFRYNRGDGMVTGPSVYLARELARCWGNMQSGVAELRRDDDHGQSEMQAWAWDVQTNSRMSTTFIVPHARDTKKGRRDLTELRDIYENNANNAARRLREMILGLLPQWFVEEAKDICTDTIRHGGGKPLAERVTTSAEAFATEFSIDRARLEKRIGHPSAAWTAHDVATLGVIFQSLRRGEIRVEDEFPVDAAPTVTAADLGPAPASAPTAPPTPGQAGSTPAAPAATPTPATSGPLPPKAWRAIQARFNELGVVGVGQAERRREVMCRILDRQVAKPDDLTAADGELILANLANPTGPRIVADVLGPFPVDEQAAPAPEPEAPAAEAATASTEAQPDLVDDDPAAGYDPTLDEDWGMDGAEAEAEGR